MNAVPILEGLDDDLARRHTLAKLLAYATLLDLLVLPYFQLVIVPFSLPLVLFALLVLRVRISIDDYLILFLLLAAAVLASCVVSMIVLSDDTYLPENIKRAVQLLSSFAYFFYFRWLAQRVELRINAILYLFVAWFGALAVLFFFNPSGTGDLIRAFYGRTVTAEETIEEHLRFAYLFTDPNTAGYFLLVATAPLLTQRRAMLSVVFYAAVLLALTLLTQSKGALAALVLMVLSILYPLPKLRQTLFNARGLIVLSVLALCAYLGFTWMTNALDDNPLLKAAYERIFESRDQYLSGGSRFTIWQHFAGIFMPLPLGEGYTLLVDGIPDRPHSDLLRVLYSYGFLALLPLLMFLFRRFTLYTALMLPALMTFCINSLLDEQKLLSIYLALLAIHVGSAEFRERSAQRNFNQ